MPKAQPDQVRWRRFGDDLRRALMVAHEIARAQACPAVDAEHLALGLLDLPDCAARRVLVDLGVDLGALRADLVAAAAARCVDAVAPPDDLRLTPRAERALQIAYVEARTDCGRRGVSFESRGQIGTQHLLLGLTSPAGEVDLAALRLRGVFYGEVGEMVRRIPWPDDGTA